jgi:hypothetical protein
MTKKQKTEFKKNLIAQLHETILELESVDYDLEQADISNNFDWLEISPSEKRMYRKAITYKIILRRIK